MEVAEAELSFYHPSKLSNISINRIIFIRLNKIVGKVLNSAIIFFFLEYAGEPHIIVLREQKTVLYNYTPYFAPSCRRVLIHSFSNR